MDEITSKLLLNNLSPEELNDLTLKLKQSAYQKMSDIAPSLSDAEYEQNLISRRMANEAAQKGASHVPNRPSFLNIPDNVKSVAPVIEEGARDIDVGKYRALKASGQLDGQIAKENALKMLGKAGRLASKVAGPIGIAHDFLNPEEANAGSDIVQGKPLSPEEMYKSTDENEKFKRLREQMGR